MGLLSAEGAEIEAELLLAYEMPRELSRYLSTHKYNISLMHLVDQIASPYPKALMDQRTNLNLDAWPTPQDYYYNIREGTLLSHKHLQLSTLLFQLLPNHL